MKILKLQTLRGPNYWSIRRHNLIVIHLDLGALKEVFSDQIPHFAKQLHTTLPSLMEHGCASGWAGGFFEQVNEGTLMGHVVEHVALELQCLAGMPVTFSRTRATADPGIYRVAFEYFHPEAGRYAAKAAVRLCQRIVDRGHYAPAELESDIAALRTWTTLSLTAQLSRLYAATTSPIPVIAVTGTTGKTVTTRLIAHLLKQTRKTVGCITSDGAYIGDRSATPADGTDAQDGAWMFNHPTVELAVLETSRENLLHSGLAVDRCDVGVVLNVAADQVGVQDIYTLDDMAYVKSIVVEATKPEGYAVLNADDPLVLGMANRVEANVAFFSMNRWSPVIWKHVRQGGLAAIYEDGYVSLLTHSQVLRVEQVRNIPLTLHGLAPSMTANALAATLTAYIQGVSIADISTGLRTFQASVEQLPGRMHLIQRGDFHVLLECGHTPASYEALSEIVSNWSSGERVGVVGAPGDRRNCDYLYLGKLAAQLFERVIVKEDDNPQNRQPGEVAEWISRGIEQQNPDCDYDVILDESTAIVTAIAEATPGSLIVVLPADVERALAVLHSPDQVSVH